MTEGLNTSADPFNTGTEISQGSLTSSDEILLNKYSHGIVVELGTFLGRSATILSYKAEKVYTIDIFLGRSDFPKFNYENVKNYLNQYKNIELIKGLTHEVVTKFENNSIDVLFIDASHTFDNVMRDYVFWFSKVKKGGTIIFHDYIKIWKEIMNFVDVLIENDKNIKKIEQSGYCIVFEKVKDLIDLNDGGFYGTN